MTFKEDIRLSFRSAPAELFARRRLTLLIPPRVWRNLAVVPTRRREKHQWNHNSVCCRRQKRRQSDGPSSKMMMTGRQITLLLSFLFFYLDEKPPLGASLGWIWRRWLCFSRFLNVVGPHNYTISGLRFRFFTCDVKS